MGGAGVVTASVGLLTSPQIASPEGKVAHQGSRHPAATHHVAGLVHERDGNGVIA